MYFKNLSLKKYELKHKDNMKGILNDEKKTLTRKGGSGSNVVRATVEFLALMPKVG